MGAESVHCWSFRLRCRIRIDKHCRWWSKLINLDRSIHFWWNFWWGWNRWQGNFHCNIRWVPYWGQSFWSVQNYSNRKGCWIRSRSRHNSHLRSRSWGSVRPARFFRESWIGQSILLDKRCNGRDIHSCGFYCSSKLLPHPVHLRRDNVHGRWWLTCHRYRTCRCYIYIQMDGGSIADWVDANSDRERGDEIYLRRSFSPT